MRLVSGAVGRLGAVLPVSVLCLIGAPPASSQSATLRVSLPISIDSAIGQNIREFARQVEARTGGTVKFELQVKDRLYDELGVVSGVATGAIEIGATSLNQFAHYVPLAGAFLQPFLFNFDALVQAATSRESKIRALIEREILDGTNARVLWWQPYGSSVILSRSILATNPAAIAARFVGAPDDQIRESDEGLRGYAGSCFARIDQCSTAERSHRCGCSRYHQCRGARALARRGHDH